MMERSILSGSLHALEALLLVFTMRVPHAFDALRPSLQASAPRTRGQ
jgi:hypothetical protein